MKSFTLFILATVVGLAFAQAQTDLFSQQTDDPSTGYTPSSQFSDIQRDVDREALSFTQASQFVLYNTTNAPVSSAPPSSPAPLLSSARGWGEWASKHDPIPGDQPGLKKYLSILQPQEYSGDQAIQASNAGIASWFRREVGSNRCLEHRAVDFYTAVGKKLAGLRQDNSSLSENVRTESGGRLKPGWLWDLAMTAAGQDAGVAMTLIGMCGHDDQAQAGPNSSAFTFGDDTEQARASVYYKAQRYSDIADDIQSQIKHPTVPATNLVSTLRSTAARLKSPQTHTYATIACPTRPSLFFSNESLGSGVDIPSTLKDRIQSVQNPDKLFDIPAKNYHIYSGAFLACQMIESGMSATTTKLWIARGAREFRGIYLCNTLARSDIGSVPDGYDSPEAFLMSADMTRKCADHSFAPANEGVCALIGQATYYRNNIRNPNELQRKISGMVANSDASTLFRRWYMGNSYTTIGSRCALNENPLPPEADTGYDFLNSVIGRKPFNMSTARYENAKRKLNTWIEDSNWTVAQQSAGADFAAKWCHPRPAGHTMENDACKADKTGPAPRPAAPARATH